MCDQDKDEAEFYVKDKKSGRLFSWCKTCHSRRCLERYHGNKHEENKEKNRLRMKARGKDRNAEYARKWRLTNRERARETNRRHEEKRKDDPTRKAKKRTYGATYRRKHADAIDAYNAAYRDENREFLRLRSRQWRKDNPEGEREIRARWKQANRATVNAATHRRRAAMRGCAGEYTQEEWLALKEAQDFICLCCGAREPEISLTPDHVTPVSKGGDNTVVNLQGLCLPCNLMKNDASDDYRDEDLSAFLADLLERGIDAAEVVPPGDDEPADEEDSDAGAGLAADELPLAGNRRMWKHLDAAGRDRYASRIAAHYRQIGYPHYRLDDGQIRLALEQLLAYRERAVVQFSGSGGGVILTGSQAMGLCWSYFPHAVGVRCNGRRTALETFQCDRWLRRAIRRRLDRGDYLSDAGVRKALRTASGVQSVSNFRPTAAMAIYSHFRKPGGLRVWDMSSGYGGRLLGAMASGHVSRYVGTEPCSVTFDGLKSLLTDVCRLGILPHVDVDLIMTGSEDHRPLPGSLDLCFTSPPYFSTERYSDEPTQSFLRFPRYADWLDGFLRRTLENCWIGLVSGGALVLNVADCKAAPTLVADVERIAEEVGFRQGGTLRLALSHLTAGGHKYEPILTFMKP